MKKNNGLTPLEEMFKNFNLGTSFQKFDLDELSKDDRFAYVPEMLCVNKDQISLVLFEV